MPAVANLVHQQSTDTGTGNLTLSAVNGKQTFANAFGTGGTNVFDYFISNQGAAEYERGKGHITSGALVRDTVIESTNANAAVSFSAGTKDIVCDIPAANQAYSEDSTTTDGYGVVMDGTTGRKIKSSGYRPREVLTANRTYYVRTDGSDSNNGLANTSGGAFLTVQKAINAAVAIDLAGFAVTIQVADGTYTGAISLTTPFLGGLVTLQGNNGTPANVVISTTSADAIGVNGYGIALTVKDMKLQTTTAGNCIYAQNGAQVNFQNLNFGACAERHVRAKSYAHVQATGSFTISGSATNHVLAFGGFYELAALTVTLSGTPAFSGGTFNLDSAGSVSLFSVTFSGSATGKRYSVTLNSVLNSFGAGSASTYFPGNSNGTTATGGQQA